MQLQLALLEYKGQSYKTYIITLNYKQPTEVKRSAVKVSEKWRKLFQVYKILRSILYFHWVILPLHCTSKSGDVP